MKRSLLLIVTLSYVCPTLCASFDRKQAIIDLAVEQCISGKLSQRMLIHIHEHTTRADSSEQLDLIFAKVPLMTALWMSYRKQPLMREAAYKSYLGQLYNIKNTADLIALKKTLRLIE